MLCAIINNSASNDKKKLKLKNRERFWNGRKRKGCDVKLEGAAHNGREEAKDSDKLAACEQRFPREFVQMQVKLLHAHMHTYKRSIREGTVRVNCRAIGLQSSETRIE